MARDAEPSDAYTPLIAARLGYRAGICVLPPVEDGSKRPEAERVTRAELSQRFTPEVVDAILSGPEVDERVTWKHRQYERPTPDEYRRWYAEEGRTGVGAVCGRISANLEAFEFDDAATYHAFKAAADEAGLEPLVARIERGYCEESPSGGIHWLYRCAEIAGSTPLARRPGPFDAQGRPSVEVLIETRGEGGCLVTAPTYGAVHPSGRPYRLLSGSFAEIVQVEPGERAQLWELARGFDELPEARRGVAEAPKPVLASEDERRPGDDYETRGPAWADLLEPHGWRLAFRRGATEYWRRPGKDRGISATINGPGITPEKFYVFSSSTVFPPNASYSKFGAYAVLEHGGDYQAAARALGAQGYGTPPKAAAPASRDEPQPREPRPAQSAEDERALLATILEDPDPLAALAHAAIPQDFVDPGHRRIYAALLRLLRGGKAADALRVREEVRRATVAETAAALLAGAEPEGTTVEQAVSETTAAIATIDAITQRGASRTTRELVLAYFDSVDSPRPEPVRTGFHDLDMRIGGLLPGQLITVAAMTRMGKSSFCLGIAHHIGTRLKLPVGIISLEMPEPEVLLRLACLSENFSTKDIQGFNGLDDRRQKQVMDTMAAIAESPITIDGSGNRDLTSVLGRARAMHARHGLRLLVIDYAQLLRDGGGGRNDNRTVELGRVSGALKQLAMELRIPVLTAAQINRNPLARADKMPDLEDIRESASLGMDSDIVVIIHRPAELDHDKVGDIEAKAEVSATLAKNRDGETGKLNLRFVAHRAMFVNGATRHYQ